MPSNTRNGPLHREFDRLNESADFGRTDLGPRETIYTDIPRPTRSHKLEENRVQRTAEFLHENGPLLNYGPFRHWNRIMHTNPYHWEYAVPQISYLVQIYKDDDVIYRRGIYPSVHPKIFYKHEIINAGFTVSEDIRLTNS